MTSPFLDKSPTELLAMVPDLSDPELDALCAKYCLGWKPRCTDHGGQMLDWWQPPGWPEKERGQKEPPPFTSDGREAMRLLVKYRISVCPMGDTSWWVRQGLEKTPIHINDNPCRAIALAAVTCALTRTIEGDGE